MLTKFGLDGTSSERFGVKASGINFSEFYRLKITP